ncbi:P-type conjugative transfer protein TrbL [Xanthomonas nasturtii]|uniref:P-type conjugative transfer protein TrbL n=1 Tax=Xanthomonas nasturtii TaxID=1843581 RepID=UPI002013924C|nr:P-type conjugative transfer protein TrbL [Xanthomonas nasturtii]MCL1574861.1 P-type conjugative transfer protein TrbL [Xanthomonas nasturtii]MCL1586503.1 P-type conjugative transfer protein TrbL [Xanthomonas nasturtii]
MDASTPVFEAASMAAQVLLSEKSVEVMSLAGWVIQGWVCTLTIAVIVLASLFRRHGANADYAAPTAMAIARIIVKVTGGTLLFSFMKKSDPYLYRSIFFGNAPRVVTRLDAWKPWLLAAGMLATMILLSPDATAQTMGDNMLDDTTNFYIEQSKQMDSVLKPLALRLFGLLTVISFSLFFIRQALNAGDSVSMFGKFSFEIFKAGFFLWIINVGPNYAFQFLGYFTGAGMKIGQAGELSPSGIVVLGFDACFRTFDAIGRMGWGDTAAFGLPLALCGIGMLLCFAVVGILLMIRLIEMHMVVYGGVLLLGFGGISFTRDIPKNYLSYAISSGTQLFMIYVIVGMGMQLADSWPATLSTSATPDSIVRQVLQLGVAALVFASLAWSIPKAAASLVNGAVSMGTADVFGPAGAAAGGAAAGAAIATGGVSTLAAASKGAMQATRAGTTLATQQGASGVGAWVKGLGNAAGAMKSEAGSALKAKAGFAPPSLASTDGHGRKVDNLGTRAANNLQTQTQTAAAAKAGVPEQAGEVSEGLSISSTDATAYPGSSLPTPDQSEQYSATEKRQRSPIRPPQLPPDTTPNSAVSIRSDLED